VPKESTANMKEEEERAVNQDLMKLKERKACEGITCSSLDLAQK